MVNTALRHGCVSPGRFCVVLTIEFLTVLTGLADVPVCEIEWDVSGALGR